MKSLDLLKQANRILNGLIAEKTPPVLDTCRKAYADLGDLIRLAVQNRYEEVVTPAFAAGIDQVISKIDVLRAGHGKLQGEPVKFSHEEFASYFQLHIDKALQEEPTSALRRLHSLQASVEKALKLEYTNDSGVELVPFVDPWQQATVEQVGDGPKKVTSGTANQAEVKATPGLSLDDVMKGVATSIEKALSVSKQIDTGWSNDLTSKEFLQGERRWDFGTDFSKA